MSPPHAYSVTVGASIPHPGALHTPTSPSLRPTSPAPKPAEAGLPIPKPSARTPTPPLPRQASPTLEFSARPPCRCRSRPPPLWSPPHANPSAAMAGLSRHRSLRTTSPRCRSLCPPSSRPSSPTP
ncbi:hypothetical protein GUJ93_ZPchr0010g7207 [Zizania palustris]|uniref:Uncharacterized protein n=1 Tax=Zizania palustris TaxID=103762 RepID=A0A8J5W858_ZIZPA|nr:hypothetical protein GUJ93_ZPchr0010g7207 [Zizania palustris]